MPSVSRRLFLSSVVGATASLAGCSADRSSYASLFSPSLTGQSLSGRTLAKPNYTLVYSSLSGEHSPVSAFDYAKVDPVYLRQEVEYQGPGEPGTIVVDPASKHLYIVDAPGRATRYGVGVGREGFGWSGSAQINMRRTWPDWVPPREMVERDPAVYAQLVSTSRGLGVPGGSRSPLGARALYLFAEGGDTGYRIHGTTEPETIGTEVSSGCIRMVNQDVIHLYQRAPEGTKVVVLA